MKISITFEIQDATKEQAEYLLHNAATAVDLAKIHKEHAPKKDAEPAAEEKPKRKRRTKKEIEAEKKAKADAEAAEAETSSVSLDELKAAVRECVDAAGVEAVKEVFEKHKATKLSELEVPSYPDVLADLQSATIGG